MTNQHTHRKGHVMKHRMPIAAALLTVVVALSGCGEGSDASGGSQSTPSTASAAQNTGARATPSAASKGKLPSYKGKTLHAAITDLRERKVGYTISGPGFEQSKEVSHTREWFVTDQKAAKDGKSVSLTVEKKEDEKK